MAQTSDLEDRVSRLEHDVAALTQRLADLEKQPAARPARPAAASEDDDFTPSAATIERVEALTGVPALAGRTCLAVGGAFLVRTLTESGTLSAAVGVTLGVVYALVWLFLADRAAARGNDLSGAFHALASALIVYPLVLEATLRFQLLPPAAAAVLLSLATGLGLFVAWRHSFRTVAWINVLAALSIGALLLFRTRSVLPFVVYLLALGVGSLVLAYGRGWRIQRWVVALALDLVVLLLGLLRIAGKAPPEWLAAEPVLLAQFGLSAIYISAFVLRLLVQARDVTPFAITQTVLVLLIGFEGALLVGETPARTAIALAALALGIVLHAVLARRSEAQFGHGVAVAYFSSLATFFAAEACRVLLPAAYYPIVWICAAVVLAGLALPGRRPILQVHATILGAAAAVACGLLYAALVAFARPARLEWPPFTPHALVVLGLIAVAAALVYRGATRADAGITEAVTRSVFLALAFVLLGGLIVRLVGGAVAQAPGPDAAPGALAVVRSAVLACAAILLALWRAYGGRAELARLAWAALAVGGLKLLFEDLRVGTAGSLVFSLALYGTALIVVQALARRARPAPEAAAVP